MPRKKKASKELAVVQEHPLAGLLTKGQISALIKPTPREYINKRPGRGGMMFDYVSIGYVVKQLDEVFGQWSFDVEEVGDMNLLSKTGHVVVKGKLTVHLPGKDIVKVQYGSAEIKLNRSSGKPVDVGDDFKSAASDALKKCASFLGIARDVYFRDWDKFSTPKSESVSLKATLPTGGTVVKPIDQYREEVFNLAKETLKDNESIKQMLIELTGQASFKKLDEKQLDDISQTLEAMGA